MTFLHSVNTNCWSRFLGETADKKSSRTSWDALISTANMHKWTHSHKRTQRHTVVTWGMKTINIKYEARDIFHQHCILTLIGWWKSPRVSSKVRVTALKLISIVINYVEGRDFLVFWKHWQLGRSPPCTTGFIVCGRIDLKSCTVRDSPTISLSF